MDISVLGPSNVRCHIDPKIQNTSNHFVQVHLKSIMSACYLGFSAMSACLCAYSMSGGAFRGLKGTFR